MKRFFAYLLRTVGIIIAIFSVFIIPMGFMPIFGEGPDITAAILGAGLLASGVFLFVISSKLLKQ